MLYQLSYACLSARPGSLPETVRSFQFPSSARDIIVPYERTMPARTAQRPRRSRRHSTLEKKLKRHRNKLRIWRRAVKRLAELKEDAKKREGTGE